MAERTRTVAVDVDEQVDQPTERTFSWPWPLVAVLGAVGVALAGWVLVAGVATIVWLAASSGPFGEALGIATQVFALGHGVPAELAGQRIDLVPLGLSVLLVFLAVPVVGQAARRAAEERGRIGVDGDVHVDLERLVWVVAGTHAAVYAVAVAVITGAVLGGTPAARALLGGLVVGAVAGLWGAAKGVGHDPTAHWPGWLHAVPRAMGVALLTMLAAGAVVVALAVFLGRERIALIVTGLDAGWVGVLALAVLHLLYLPNLILWAVSWLLGAGITLGDGSLVSLLITDVGFLPAVPVLGAAPEPGTTSLHMLWWLAAGVLAGSLAGVAVVWARPRARFDETSLVGGLSGVLAGLLLATAASLGSGALGVARLAHVGARSVELFVFGPVLLGLAGLAAGLVVGLLRRVPGPGSEGDDASDVEESTETIAATKEEA